MATTTPNYGWTVPTSTDLVKDGATAIETLGDAVDATVFANASAAINKTIVDAKGDLIAATAADTVARLAVGSNNQVLTADSTTATGLKWAAAAAGSMTVIASGSLSTAASSLTLSSIPATYKDLRLIVRGAGTTALDGEFKLRFNGDTSGSYGTSGSNSSTTIALTSTEMNPSYYIDADNTTAFMVLDVFDYTNTSTWKMSQVNTTAQESPGVVALRLMKLAYGNTSAINSITFFETGSKLFASGTYILYGVN